MGGKMNAYDREMKWTIALTVALWLMLGSALAALALTPPKPPVPKLPNPVLQSPKGAEAVQSLIKLAVAIPPMIHTNRVTLAWDNPNAPSNTGFVIEGRSGLKSIWGILGMQTNETTFTHVTTNDTEFYRVGAFWP